MFWVLHVHVVRKLIIFTIFIVCLFLLFLAFNVLSTEELVLCQLEGLRSQVLPGFWSSR